MAMTATEIRRQAQEALAEGTANITPEQRAFLDDICSDIAKAIAAGATREEACRQIYIAIPLEEWENVFGAEWMAMQLILTATAEHAEELAERLNNK